MRVISEMWLLLFNGVVSTLGLFNAQMTGRFCGGDLCVLGHLQSCQPRDWLVIWGQNPQFP